MKLRPFSLAFLPLGTFFCIVQAWFAGGYTQVQINIPPEKTRTTDLYVVTCASKANERRNCGWDPPTAVLQKLRGK